MVFCDMRKSTRRKLWNAAVKMPFWPGNATIPISVTQSQLTIRSQRRVQAPQSKPNEDAATAVSGTYKDADSKYSLKDLLKRQETEVGM